MELSLSTFIIEAVNFLILLWVLERIFYAPVRRAVAERQAAVAKTLSEAADARRGAQELEAKFSGRLEAWESEKRDAREGFERELAQERSQRTQALEKYLEEEKARSLRRAQDEAREVFERSEKEAVRQSLAFLSRLAAGLAGPALESEIVGMTLRELLKPGSPAADRLAGGFPGAVREAKVRTAFALPAREEAALSKAVGEALGDGARVVFEVDKSLLAGLEIACGSVVLRANLRDELDAFSEIGADGSR